MKTKHIPGIITTKYVGRHLILELYDVDANLLCDEVLIERILRDAAVHCGATILGVNSHHFGKGMGVTGVIILAESHITWHSYPEFGYIAIDIFMCGARCNPSDAIPLITSSFNTTNFTTQNIMRGTNIQLS